jgi:hypothetical protein
MHGQAQLVERLPRFGREVHRRRPDRRPVESGRGRAHGAKPFADAFGDGREVRRADFVGKSDPLQRDVEPARRNEIEVRQVPDGVLILPDQSA